MKRKREGTREKAYASPLVGAVREVKIRPEGQGSPIRERRARFLCEGSIISILEYRETISTPTVFSSWIAKNLPGHACLYTGRFEEKRDKGKYNNFHLHLSTHSDDRVRENGVWKRTGPCQRGGNRWQP